MLLPAIIACACIAMHPAYTARHNSHVGMLLQCSPICLAPCKTTAKPFVRLRFGLKKAAVAKCHCRVEQYVEPQAYG